MNVTVLGGGSWGTTVASLTTPLNPTVLWARNPEVAAEINESHANAGLSPRRHPAAAAPGDTPTWPRPFATPTS